MQGRFITGVECCQATTAARLGIARQEEVQTRWPQNCSHRAHRAHLTSASKSASLNDKLRH